MKQDKNEAIKSNKQPTFSSEQLFESSDFKKRYQVDFAKVVLGKKEYTIEEAKNILDTFFKKNKGGKK